MNWKINLFVVISIVFVKILQLINISVLNTFATKNIVIDIFYLSVGFIFAVFIAEILLEQYDKLKIRKYFWMLVVGFIIVVSVFSWITAVSFLFGLFYYASLGAEAQLIKRMEEKIKLKVIYFLLIAGVVSLAFTKYDPVTYSHSSIIVLASSIFSTIIAYTLKESKSVILFISKPPVGVGIALMSVSVVLYYFFFRYLAFIAPFMFLFYFGGATIVYLFIDDYINAIKVKKK